MPSVWLRSKRGVQLLAILGGLAAVSDRAAGQSSQYNGASLYIGFVSDWSCTPPACAAPRLLHIDPDNRRIVAQSPLSRNQSWMSYATPDGRYLLGARGLGGFTSELTGLDLLTGAPWGMATPLVVNGPVGHPTRLQAFAIDEQRRPMSLSASGIRVLPGACPAGSIGPISANGRLVFQCNYPPGGLVVYDVDREQVLLTRPQGTAFPTALSPDGLALYIFEDAPRATLRKYAIDSGVMLAERSLEHAGWMYVDPYAGRVFVVGDQRVTMPEDGVLVLDPDTLATVAVGGPELGTYWAFDPERPRAFVVRAVRDGALRRNWLNVVDTASLLVQASGELPADLYPVGLTLVPRPSSPSGVTAERTGQRVRLSWQPGSRGLATHYRVEAGSSRGATDVAAVDVQLGTELVVDRVQAGRYFVRVRGVNWNGPGLASEDVVVDVP